MSDKFKRPMTLRGLQELRTSAAAIGNASTASAMPHKLHMRLCALEMERYRRESERRVAMERADKCQARCQAIEAEVRTLLAAINAQMTPPAGVEPKAAIVSRAAVRLGPRAARGLVGQDPRAAHPEPTPHTTTGPSQPSRLTHLY